MSAPELQSRILPKSPIRFLVELGHAAMAVYYCLRLMLNRKDTAPTYKFCWHLDQITMFRSRFRAHLAEAPERVERWKQKRLFVDEMPDPEHFKGYPDGSVGRCYYETWKQHTDEGLLALRERRLQTLPDERKGLDLEQLSKTRDPDDLFERIVARRNIFMTSTHDFCHMLTGSNTGIEGEALVARYQYRHLLVPQNWLNLLLCEILYVATLRWKQLGKIIARFDTIDSSGNYADLDIESLWSRPIRQVRRELGLPEAGLTPGSGDASPSPGDAPQARS